MPSCCFFRLSLVARRSAGRRTVVALGGLAVRAETRSGSGNGKSAPQNGSRNGRSESRSRSRSVSRSTSRSSSMSSSRSTSRSSSRSTSRSGSVSRSGSQGGRIGSKSGGSRNAGATHQGSRSGKGEISDRGKPKKVRRHDGKRPEHRSTKKYSPSEGGSKSHKSTGDGRNDNKRKRVYTDEEENTYEDEFVNRLKGKAGKVDAIANDEDLKNPKKLAKMARAFAAKMDCEKENADGMCEKRRDLLERIANDIDEKDSLGEISITQLKAYDKESRQIMREAKKKCKCGKECGKPKLRRRKRGSGSLGWSRGGSDEEKPLLNKKVEQSRKPKPDPIFSWWWNRFVKWSLFKSWGKFKADGHLGKFLGKIVLGVFGFLPVFVGEIVVKAVMLVVVVVGLFFAGLASSPMALFWMGAAM